MLYPDTKIIIFAKAPEAGETKTRLIPALGAEGAAELHKCMSQYIIDKMLDSNIAPVELQCYPNSQHEFFLRLLDKHCIELHRQQGDDLGERMSNALRKALADHKHAIIIGTDAPALSEAYLKSAIEQLESGIDVVIGPAEDGGYVLIGLSQHNPDIFENIDWGTEQVLAQTLDRINKSNLTLHILGVLWDVDTPSDLPRLHDDNQLAFILNKLDI